MKHDAVRQKIRGCLKKHFPDDTVDVSCGHDDNIHVVVVSHKFDGLRWDEKEDALREILEDCLGTKELTRISLIIGISPEEVKALS